MKKTSLTAIRDFLSNSGFEELNPEIMAELETELNRGKAKADATKAEYAEIHDAVMDTLRGTEQPVTAQELADETGCPKGKIVYGLAHYWQDEVTKIEGKVNSYTIKA